jgi:HPt (histidine-containing phosphotransfer) domain-containing protein
MKLLILKEKFLDIPEIDVEKGFRYCVGNLTNYKKSLLIAIKSVKAKLPLMHSMLKSNETDGLRIIAHTLIKVMDTIGADSLSQQALELETAALNNQEKETHNLLSEYILTLENFISRLETVVRSIDGTETLEEIGTSNMNYDFTKTKELLRNEYSKRNII